MWFVEETPSASSLVSARVTPAGRLFCVMTSCFVNRAGSLFCRMLTVWYSQLLISDSWGWRVSPDKTQFNSTRRPLSCFVTILSHSCFWG